MRSYVVPAASLYGQNSHPGDAGNTAPNYKYDWEIVQLVRTPGFDLGN